ncbi:MAG: cupin domain-containing protein [Pseudomonadota bacterium]
MLRPFLIMLHVCMYAPVWAQGVDQRIGVPNAVSGNSVSDYAKTGMPSACAHPRIEALIETIRNGAADYQTVRPDQTVTTGWQSVDPDLGIVACPSRMPEKPGQYCWQWLSFPRAVSEAHLPFGIGIRNGAQDTRPHYHRQRECFYVLEGEAMLNVDGAYRAVGAGKVIHAAPNSIHNFITTKPGIYAQIFWYPEDGDWNRFVYGFRSNTSTDEATAAWDRLDQMRREVGLEAYRRP